MCSAAVVAAAVAWHHRLEQRRMGVQEDVDVMAWENEGGATIKSAYGDVGSQAK